MLSHDSLYDFNRYPIDNSLLSIYNPHYIVLEKVIAVLREPENLRVWSSILRGGNR